MRSVYQLTLLLFLVSSISGFGQTAFKVVPLGVKGGADASNLSA